MVNFLRKIVYIEDERRNEEINLTEQMEYQVCNENIMKKF